jgi:ADP-ribose pyrophosphatase
MQVVTLIDMNHAWQPSFQKTDVTLLADESVHQGFVALRRFSVQFPLFEGGMSVPVEREIAFRPSAATVLLYDPKQQKVVLIEQFRAPVLWSPINPWLLDVVAGVIEAGDTPEATAIREVWEETGLKVQHLIPIHTYLPSPGILSEQVFLYCALIDAPTTGGVHGLSEESENIKVHIFSLEEAFAEVEMGHIVTAPALLALQWLKLNIVCEPPTFFVYPDTGSEPDPQYCVL